MVCIKKIFKEKGKNLEKVAGKSRGKIFNRK